MSGTANLQRLPSYPSRREGVADGKVHLVGNVMIDTLLKNRAKAERSTVLDEMGLVPGGYATMTLHRPSNVDAAAALGAILDAIEVIARDLPIVFPIHPRTRKNIADLGFRSRVEALGNLRLVDPLGYLDFLKLNANARLVLTDSGGLQEETTILRVPCITIRENTERPVTCQVGSNQLVGTSTRAILAAYERIKTGQFDQFGIPDLWDGQAAQRIARILVEA
ncbi:MAG: UDP-N-acetyl glucosamine 2-epimerase [Planctomycetaceae bacterium]|nr:UDP-N-acetyl glucosamine 2-epimerase [Planctomycetaceae bacterium]